jgi:hypothetical protein
LLHPSDRVKPFSRCKKGKAIPLQAPEGSRKVEVPIFQDNQHMNVVRLSALRTGRLYPHSKHSWYSFLLETESAPQCHSAARKIPMKTSGIEPATFRLVARCLNQLCHRVPPFSRCKRPNKEKKCTKTHVILFYIYYNLVWPQGRFNRSRNT